MPQSEISLYSLLLAVGSIQALFLILTLLTTGKKRKSANSILAILMALFAYDLLDEFLLQTGYIFIQPNIAMFVHATDLAYGPVIYFYTRRLTANAIRLKHWMNLLPPLLALLTIIFHSFHFSRQDFVDYLLEKDNANFVLEITDFIISMGGLLSMVIYIVISLRLLAMHRALIAANYSYTEAIDLNWLRQILMILTLLIAIYFGWFISVVFLQGAFNFFEQLLYLSIVISIFFLGFKGIRQPRIFVENQPLYRPTDPVEESENEDDKVNTNYQGSALDQNESALIFDELQKLMAEKRLYLAPKFSLSDLAQQSGFKIHYISQAINQNLKQNFFDYINQYRIGYATELLTGNPDQVVNILQVAMDCGFNSKSSFYQAFRKHTGKTPGEYRKTVKNA